MTKHENIGAGLQVSRRAFLVGAGAAGVVVGLGLSEAAFAAAALCAHRLVFDRR